MNRINTAIERFLLRHPGFGIPRLLQIIAGGNLLVYLLFMFTGGNLGVLSFLTFDLAHLLKGEVWRLVTFVLMPTSFRPLSLILMLTFCYFVGGMLERELGTAKCTLYYLSGMILSVLAVILASLITGNFYLSLSGAYYLNLTIFLAFAVRYPEAQVLLYFIIPLKARWIAWADLALFAWSILSSLLSRSLTGALLPLAVILNFIAFFWDDFVAFFGGGRAYRPRPSRKTVQFEAAARQQRQREQARGYRRKCEVCGRTDTDFPDLEFRYCSRCKGYHCYCMDHIYNHTHITQ